MAKIGIGDDLDQVYGGGLRGAVWVHVQALRAELADGQDATLRNRTWSNADKTMVYAINGPGCSHYWTLKSVDLHLVRRGRGFQKSSIMRPSMSGLGLRFAECRLDARPSHT